MNTLQIALLTFLSVASMAAAPKGWMVAGSAPGDYEFGTEDAKAADGSKSAYIKSKPDAKGSGFGTLMQMFAADDYRGGRWKLTARMRTEDATKAQLWMRVDGPDNKMNAFDNMDDRPATGDSEWKRYEVVLDVAPDSVAVAFGFFLFGGGQVWADDFKLERVTTAVPVTGKGAQRPRNPQNLDFDQ
ncbi:MAG TPA: hypothetical protein VFU13_08215 [Steroidobacteraceae bacterium]|nr:hypothetical protein [Steroidobacteraceae bacterium]